MVYNLCKLKNGGIFMRNKTLVSLMLAVSIAISPMSLLVDNAVSANEVDLISNEVREMKVNVSIIAFNEDGSYTVKEEPSMQTIDKDMHESGFTVLGALQATADEYVGDSFITSINGIEAPDTGGWMFTVNGEVPQVGAGEVELKEGDQVLWYCTYDWQRDQAPIWEDLVEELPEEGEFTQVEIKDPNKTTQKAVLLELLQEKPNSIDAKISSDLLKKCIDEKIDIIKVSSDLLSFELYPNSMNINTVDDMDISIKESPMNISLELKQGQRVLNNFKKPIKISLAYEQELASKENLTVELTTQELLKENLGGIYDDKAKTISFTTNKLGEFNVRENIKSFDDLAKYGWAKNAINSMASKGIINGKSQGEFDPSASITRAEFSTLVSRALKLDVNSEKELPFTDVKEDLWYFESVKAMYENGLVNGKSETTFDPEGNITREEIAKITGQVLENSSYKKQDKNVLDKFNDKENISNWAEEGSAITIHNNLMVGNDGNFMPKEKATRAEIAVVLYRLYDLTIN